MDIAVWCKSGDMHVAILDYNGNLQSEILFFFSSFSNSWAKIQVYNLIT